MSVRRRLRAPSRSDRPPRDLLEVVLLAVIGAGLLCVLAVTFVGSSGAVVDDGQYAHGNETTDDEGPVMVDGERINDTAVEVTIVDNHDVDEDSVIADNFLLSHGQVRGVGVSESGSNATVTVLLDRRVNVDNLTVAVKSGANISDTNGNYIDVDESVAVVSGMDGVAPAVQEFTVTNATGGPATIRLDATEDLGNFNISVFGPEDDSFDRSTFTRTGVGEYERTYRPPADGLVTVRLTDLTDESGNTRDSGFKEQILVDLTAPEASAGIDLANSANLSITFDGTGSTDENGVVQYRWDFGDGTTATGKRVSHDFLPGNYTVTLNVSDPYGNTATDTVTLNLSNGSGDVSEINETQLRDRVGNNLDVSVTRPTGNVTGEAFVTVENARVNETIRVGELDSDGTALAAHSGVTLGGMAVTLSANRSYNLGLSMAGASSVSDAAAETSTRPVAGFTVTNTVPDADIRNATVRFSLSRDRLDALGASPGEVSLYRLHDGEWRQLNTTALQATNQTQPFRAESPGFSRFAVLVETSAVFSVTATNVTEGRVEPDEPFSVTATVANDGDGRGTFTGALEVDGSAVRTENVTLNPGTERALSFTWGISEAGTYDLSVNGTSAGELVVGAVDESTDNQSTNDSEQFVVTDASLDTEQVPVEEPFIVNATVENTGEEAERFTAGLEVDGSVVYTKRTSQIPPNESREVQIQYFLEESGEYSLSVNGTEAGTLQVGDTGEDDESGGGLLASVLGLVPVGLVRPLVLFVVAPLVVIVGVLKGLAYYLGY